MMVFDQTNMSMTNNEVPMISSTETKLDTKLSSTKRSKSLSKRSSSFKQKGTSLTKSASSTLTDQRARVSETLKKSVVKELNSQASKSRSRSTSPPARSASSKIGSKEKKEKKKKKKKTVSDTSLRVRSLDEDESIVDATDADSSTQNSTFPLHSQPAKSSSEVTGKKKVRRKKSSKTDSLLVAELIQNHQSLGVSEHTTDTVSTSGSIDDGSSSNYKKASAKKKVKRPDNKDKSSSEEDDSVALTTSAQATVKKQPNPKSRRPGLNSFESIHGKSIHKPKIRRGSMTNTTTDISEIRNGNQMILSPTQTHGTLSSPPSSGTKKKSVLKAKREKQKQEQAEQEKEELKARLARTMVQKNKEDYIHEVLDIVNSNHNPKSKSAPSRSQFLARNNAVDPDECSSQSSSCSIVSDGSYEKDDLLSHTSDHSDERTMTVETPANFGLVEDTTASGEEASFAMEVDSPKKNSFNSITNSPSEGSFAEEIGNRDDGFKDTLLGAMASSMSALPEVEDENDSSPIPAASHPKPVLKKTALKVGKPPLRMVPKRSQSDVTSLKSMSNNVVRIRLPGQRKTITRQRSLTFNEKVRVKRIPCQAQVAEGDVSDLWFQPEEYEAIKRKTMALIRAVQDDQTGGVTYCTRGLERYFAVDDVQEKRNDAWDSVLDEQEAQRANREAFNADRMSQLYTKTTLMSRQEAIERGKLDEDAIARYTRKMRQTLRRTYSMPV